MLKRNLPVIAALATMAMATLQPGRAVAGDEMAGADLAKRWCSACHATGNSPAARDMAPSFVTIANDPNRSDDRLRAWLADPHPPMPNPGLTRIEIENVIAYLASLRRN